MLRGARWLVCMAVLCAPQAARQVRSQAPAASATAATPPAPKSALTFSATLRHGAYREPGAPSVVVHVPAGFDPAPPLELVVFLHGFMGCAQVLVAEGQVACRKGDREQDGWALGRLHDAARTNSVLVVPQLAFMKRSAKPGCFARRGCFDAFVDELVAELRTRLAIPQLNGQSARLTLVAHSGGYQTALAILARSRASQRVQHVVLMDALYGGAPELASWLQRNARRGARVLSIHLGAGSTRRGSKDLYRRARRSLGAEQVAELRAAELDAALGGDERLGRKALLVATGRGAHRLVPESYLTRVLAAWLPGRR